MTMMLLDTNTWIEAHAVCLGLPLVTANTREVMRVENVELDNWVSA